MMRRQQVDDQQSKLLYELSTLVLNILRSPTTTTAPFDFSDQSAVTPRPAMQQITPGGFASLLLGVSLSLMLCGSVTFFIGFLMMPWVLVLVMVLYVAGILSAFSMIARAIFCPLLPPPPSSSSHLKDVQSCKIL
ncbi:uncharacterized protein LOC132641296 isoform X2 [Lycium barbarum]|uniref:uncharacterized protein LOC132641296 isoform X2 n=1 Tax=Lycium barbarum TaxID=112863 RepID=UPI00293F6870|nr:uncharacterized protein LOC132641296 isoform X2 [Lycium barbarum]